MLFSFTKDNSFGLKKEKKSLAKDVNLFSQTSVPMIFAIILGPCDFRKLPPEDYISGAIFLRGEQTPVGVDLKNEKSKVKTL